MASEAFFARIERSCDAIAGREAEVRALLPEEGRRERLIADTRAALDRWPDRDARPPLFGVLVAVKDIIGVDGFETRAGSTLPPALFAGPEAAAVTRLRDAGALILGKTHTSEFACIDACSTANPLDPSRTPGGSSSGSAAAVAAGYASLALGTQTVGSIIRPASFCGIVGFKPSFGRVPLDGVLPCAPSLDHLGVLCADLETARRAAEVLVDGWSVERGDPASPVLAVPDGPLLELLDDAPRAAFEADLQRLAHAGLEVRRVEALGGLTALIEHNQALVGHEFARVHQALYAEHSTSYGPANSSMIVRGRTVGDETVRLARVAQKQLRAELSSALDAARADAWICPSALGPAPQGLASTGSPAMSLPWSFAGLPALSVPAKQALEGMPLGLQLVARFGRDEALHGWASSVVRGLS